MPGHDMSDAIDLLDTGTYTVVRTADNTTVNGYLVAGGTTTFSVRASIQPMKKKNTRQTEGVRTEDTIIIFTSVELKAADGTVGVADQVNYKNRNFVVTEVEDFSTLGNYYRVTATRSFV